MKVSVAQAFQPVRKTLSEQQIQRMFSVGANLVFALNAAGRTQGSPLHVNNLSSGSKA
jgi:transposase